MGDEIGELLAFLGPDTRADVRSTALDIVKGLTVAETAKTFFTANLPFLDAIIRIADEEPFEIVRRDAFLCLINLSEQQALAEYMVDKGVLQVCMRKLVAKEEKYPDEPSLVIANISRHATLCKPIIELEHDGKPAIHLLVDIFCRPKDFNENGAFHHLASIFSNITQSKEGRDVLTARDKRACILHKLVCFTQYEGSRIRRLGVAGALRNCCFDVENHAWLLSEEVDFLPNILLPLAGPEELDDDDMEDMLDDLQYLPPEKEREPDAGIRTMLLEALLQLCASKVGRETLRKVKAYPILREYHKWEKDPVVVDACEKVVSILIDDEPDSVNNIKEEVAVSAEEAELLDKAEADFREEVEKLSVADDPTGDNSADASVSAKDSKEDNVQKKADDDDEDDDDEEQATSKETNG